MAVSFHLGIVLLIALSSTVNCNKVHYHNTNSTEWDVLIFTQHWPITVCHDWKERGHNHSCTLPQPEQSWTIHGVWPTRLGSEGPAFCNKDWIFNVNQIRSIEKALDQLWINVEKDTPLDSLWAHEWNKHGTCAAAIPALGSELLYFGQGLQWQKKYTMNVVLAAGDIFPNSRAEYRLTDIHKTIKEYLRVEPIIQCEVKHAVNYLFELRLCFSKNLDLIDCVGEKNTTVNDVVIQTNCDPEKTILYPPSLPVADAKSKMKDTKFYLELYWFLSWLQWFTL